MRYLEEYRNYKLNEKVSWKDILLFSVVFFSTRGFIKSYDEYSVLNSLYTQINSSDSRPTKAELDRLESIRKSLIDEISKSPKWKKFGKENLLDSLKRVQFRMIDSSNYFKNVSKNSAACFINLEIIKDETRFIVKGFLKEPSENNLIVIRKDLLYDPHLSGILIHEIYHYLDKLLIANYDFSNFLDVKVLDKDYASKKLSFLFKNKLKTFKNDNDISSFKLYNSGNVSVDLYDLTRGAIDPFLSKLNYYRSNSEIFARWMTLKTDMVKLGIIQHFDDKITIEDISKYLEICDSDAKNDCHDIMMVLDWSKIDKFQDVLIQ